MLRTKLTTLVMVLAMAGLMIMPSKAQAQARPTSIAVADVAKIMGALEEMTQLEADAKTQIEQIKIEHETRRKNLQQMQEDLELLQQGTDAFMQKAEELQLSAMQLESWFKYKQARMGSERVLQVANVYLLPSVGDMAWCKGLPALRQSVGCDDMFLDSLFYYNDSNRPLMCTEVLQ